MGSPGAYRYHGRSRLIDDPYPINDDAEIYSSFRKIFQEELELKMKHQGRHANFLDLDITDITDNEIFVDTSLTREMNFDFF